MRTYHGGMNKLRTGVVVLMLVAICVAPVFSQDVTDPVIAANEEIARTAGRLLPAALDLTPGTDTVSLAVGSILVDGQIPRSATLLSAMVSDELFSRASTLRARRGVDILAAGPSASASTLELMISGSVGETEAAFVVQVVERAGGIIRASARQSITLTPAIVTAFQPVVAPGGTTGGGDPTDVSDDPEYAQSVALDTVVSGGRIHAEGDHDWYVVNVSGVPEGIDGIPALLVYTTGSMDTYIEIYGPDSYGTFLNENDDGGDDTNGSLSFTVENNQTYWILVRAFADSGTGSYDLHVETTVIEPDRYEPNDDRMSSSSVDLSAGDAVASIRPSGDTDWYEIDIQSTLGPLEYAQDQRLALETIGSIDTVMSVYDRNNNELAYNDDGGDGSNARVLIPIDSAGPLYVEVRGYGDWVEGDYMLTYDIVEVITDEFEPDDSQAQAQSAELGGAPQTRSFSSDSDVDWVFFDIDAETYPNGTTVRMFTEGYLDTYMILYNDFGSEIARSDDDGTDYNALIERQLAPGRYFVELYPLYLDGTSGTYTFVIDADY